MEKKMTTEITAAPQHDIQGLLADLDTAERNFTAAADRAQQARQFLHFHKGRLNEHQYSRKLEDACSNQAAAAAVIAAQGRLRCLYYIGRLAVSAVCPRYVRLRDKLVRQTTKILATLPYVMDSSAGVVLAARCLESANKNDILFGALAHAGEKEEKTDPTGGQGLNSLYKTYQRLISEGVSGLELVVLGPLNIADAVFLISLEHVDGSYQFAGTADNDQLVLLGNEVSSILTGEDYRTAWSQYYQSKSDVNEPQYVQRLQQTIASGIQATVNLLKHTQQSKRIELLSRRAKISEMYRRLQELKAQLIELCDRLRTVIGERFVEEYIHCRTVAIANVITACMLVHQIDARSASWEEELAETKDTADLCSGSLAEAVNELGGRAPYRSLSWTCYGPGSYTEPL